MKEGPRRWTSGPRRQTWRAAKGPASERRKGAGRRGASRQLHSPRGSGPSGPSRSCPGSPDSPWANSSGSPGCGPRRGPRPEHLRTGVRTGSSRRPGVPGEATRGETWAERSHPHTPKPQAQTKKGSITLSKLSKGRVL